jgi:predicted nucleic acid-binding Zn ribbon protein
LWLKLDKDMSVGRRRRQSFKSISEGLAAVLRDLGLTEKVVAYQAVSSWQEIVGTAIARHATALSVEDRTLVVAVDSPAWMTQLFYLKGQILDKISRHIGAGLITEVRFVLKR